MGALSGLTQEQVSAKLATDTAAFLANGGTIQHVPYDDSAERRARVGYWTPMGEEVLAEELSLWDDNEVAYADELLGFNEPRHGHDGWGGLSSHDEHWKFAYGDAEQAAMRDYPHLFEIDNDDDL